MQNISVEDVERGRTARGWLRRGDGGVGVHVVVLDRILILLLLDELKLIGVEVGVGSGCCLWKNVARGRRWLNWLQKEIFHSIEVVHIKLVVGVWLMT